MKTKENRKRGSVGQHQGAAVKNGWVTKRLADVILDIKDGGTPSRKNPEYFGGNVYWCVVKDIKHLIFDTAEKLTEDGLNNCSAKVWPVDSVIISLGATIGQIGIAKVPTATKQGIAGIVLNRQMMTPEFLAYGLLGQKEYIQSLATGATIKEIRPTRFAETIQLPVPPLSEQHRIVEILDKAFADIAKAKANAEQNLRNARELFESQLNEVFTKKGEGWVDKRLEDVCCKITDGTHHSPKVQYPTPSKDRFLYITSKNIRNNHMDLSQVTYIDREFHEEIYARCAPSSGDVLLTKDGANTGNVTLNLIDEPFSLLSSVALIKTKSDILLPGFLCYYLQSGYGFMSIVGQMSGAAIRRIVLKDIKRATVPFPSVAMQRSVTVVLDAVLVETQRLTRIYERKLDELEALKKSILHKAFSGEL